MDSDATVNSTAVNATGPGSYNVSYGRGSSGTATGTGIANIDALISGTKWASTNLTFAIPSTASQFVGYNAASDETGSFAALNSGLATVVRSVMSHISAYTGLDITETASASTATMLFGRTDQAFTAYAYSPGSYFKSGDVWIARTADFDNTAFGGYTYSTIVHEIGHALGLKHAHSFIGGVGFYADNSGITNAPVAANRDSLEFTVMSYRSFINQDLNVYDTYTNEDFGYPQGLMMLDIAALQQQYGADYTTNNINTVYRFSETTGQMFINGIGQEMPGDNRVFRTIWDGGGSDTYDFSNYTAGQQIDLTPGGWSLISATQRANLGVGNYARANVFNALTYGANQASLIENAIGGSGNDFIMGNAANNVLSGGAGADTLDGGAGVDTASYATASTAVVVHLDTATQYGQYASGTGGAVETDTLINIENVIGGSGDDYLYGSAGANILTSNAGNDTIAAGSGNDIIDAGDGRDFIDASYDDDFVFGGAGNDTILGGAGNDTIDGGGDNDSIDGGSGNDILSGGDGDDTIIYDAADTAANVTGGIGADTLRIINGSALTSFNLVAQGFETARHEIADATNQIWSSITDIYNASWQRQRSTIDMDDGTRQERNFDFAGNQPYSEYINYNLDVAFSNTVTRQVILEDAGTKQERFFDYRSNQAYSEYINFYLDTASPNAVTRQVIFEDPGTKQERFFDYKNNQAYSEYINFYLDTASQNAVTRQVIFEDLGTKQERFFDYNSNQVYSEYINFYADTALPNAVTRQVTFYDAGTKQERIFDHNNTQSNNSEVINFYNVAGAIYRQVGISDAGTVGWEYFY